eukprot:SAG25_NODE_2032_length_2012_cov_1.370622_3_plen_69_part_00
MRRLFLSINIEAQRPGCQWGPVPAGTPGDTTTNPSEGVQGLLNNNASNPFGKWTAIFVEYRLRAMIIS